MPALEYNLSVIGMRDIDRAFMGLERRIADHVRKVEAITAVRGGATGTGSRFSPANSNARMLSTERLALKVAADQERASRRAATQVEKDERHKTMVAERESAKRVRIAEKEARDKARAEERLHKASERAAIQSTHRTATSRMGFARAVGGNIASIGRSGLALTGLGGGAMFANAVHDYAKTGAMATQIAGKMAGKGATAEQIATIRSQVIAGSMGVKGLSSQQVLGMVGSYGGITGDYAGGMGVAPELGKLAMATGAVPEELASVAGNVSMKLAGVMKGDELKKAVLATTRMIAGQGEMGSVEVEELARYGGRITASAGVYSGSREENMAKLGAMAQIARGSGSASGAEEATTAAARMYNDINMKRKEIGAMGVTVDDAKTGKMRSADQIITDLLEKTGGSWQKISPLFGQMSEKIALGMHSVYSGAEEQKKGTGRAAVEAEMKKFTGATLAQGDVDTRAAAMAGEQSFVIAENMKKLNEAVGKELVPVVTDFVKYLGKAAPALGEFAGKVGETARWFADNPFKGLAAIVAACITKELAMAGIGVLIRGILTGGGAGVAGSAAGVAGAGALGKAGTVGMAAAVGLTTFGTTYAALAASDKSDVTARAMSELNTGSMNEFGRIASAGGSQEEIARSQLAMLDEKEKTINKISGKRDILTSLVGGGVGEENAARQTIAEQRAAAKAMLEAALALKVNAAMGGPGSAAPSTSGVPSWFGPSER